MFLYRSLPLAAIPGILVRTAVMTASVMLIIAMSQVFGYVLTVLQVPQLVADWVGGLGLSPFAFLLLVNVLLLLFGIFIEPLPGVMILVPILAPLADAAGLDPLHFAIVVIVNLTIGMITPPVGGLLFVTAVVSGVKVEAMTRELWPFLAVQIAVLALLSFIPALTLWLPHAMGYAR